jgi:hypothetical protein
MIVGSDASEKLFRKHWQIEIPDQFNPLWAQDTIEEKLPQSETLGQKAWWLYQLVLTLPLQWWEQHLELSAKELLQWAIESDWQQALLRAWHQACLREKNSTWAQVFLQLDSLKDFIPDKAALIDCLSIDKRQDAWLTLLNQADADQHRHAIMNWIAKSLLTHYQQKKILHDLPLSQSFLQKLMKNIGQYIFSKESRWDHGFRSLYLQMLCLVPQAILLETVKSWPTQVDANSATEELLAKAHQIVRIRTLFHQLTVSKES